MADAPEIAALNISSGAIPLQTTAPGVAETQLGDGQPRATSGPAMETIGPYRLIKLLGEGGMGQVWLAEQSQPVQRLVAIKIISASFIHPSAALRFAAERQTLAIMDHPAIAKVFDAGTTADGQPYYTMEYVAGEPISSYCNHHRLTVRQRLELFVRVCDGVQHAHQKAILHRDLKPSNILVAETDGRPHPRIIDFGLAKAMAEPGSDATMYTMQGQIMGTPGYMSPEQADPTSNDIDTRTDVYSLRVILYELLVDALPIEPASWQGKGVLEMVRQLRETPAPRPSTRISSRKSQLSGSSSAIAAARATEPAQLARVLRGDLDWITVKALDPERERRYESVAALADDVRRYLENLPVLAAPPSAAYWTSKFVRRHRVNVAAGAAVASCWWCWPSP